MPKKNNNQVIGKWAFIIGLVIAVIAAFISGYADIILLVLFILGLIVGFMNISKENSMKFLIALVTLLTIGVGVLNALNIIELINDYLKGILGNFIAFVSAVGLVVAIKAIVETSKG